MRKRLNWTIKVRTFILRVHYVLLAIEIILLFIGPGPQGVWILVIAENLFINIPVQRRLIEIYTEDNELTICYVTREDKTSFSIITKQRKVIRLGIINPHNQCGNGRIFNRIKKSVLLLKIFR